MSGPNFDAIRSMLSAEHDAIGEIWADVPLNAKRIIMAYAGLVDVPTRWKYMRDVERAQLARAIERAAGEFASLDAHIADYKKKARDMAMLMKPTAPPEQTAAA